MNEFMREAVSLSRKCLEDGTGGPFGAVVVKDGKIIGRGSNRVTLDNDPTAHAEVVAIRNACKELNSFQLEGCTVYTSCEPCPMCLGAIYWARPEKVYFANSREDAAAIDFDDQLIYDELVLPFDQRKIPMLHLHSEDAIQVFRDWKKLEGKVEY